MSDMYITLAILALSIVFFISGKLRSDLVALCALLLLLLFQIISPTEALAGFSNPVVVMMIGLFVVGGAIFQTGIAKMVSSRILRLAGKSETRLLVLIMLVTAGMGAFISNTGTVALMMPIVISIASSTKMSPSRLLMPLAFASSMGTFTLISTPPNLIVDDLLRSGGNEGLGFFSFAPLGAIALTVGIIVMLPLSKWFLSKKKDNLKGMKSTNKSLNELAGEYKLTSNLHRIKISPNSDALGKTIIDLNVRHNYGLIVLEIRRDPTQAPLFLKGVNQKLAIDTALEADDIIYVIGYEDNVREFAMEYHMQYLDSNSSAGSSDSIDFYDIGIAEILLLPTTGLSNKTLSDIGFRDKYNVNVLGVRRKKEYILHNIHELKFSHGDVLLVQGEWADIGRLSDETNEWVVIGQPLEEASKVTLDYKAPIAALIMVLMVVAMTVDAIPVAPVTAVLVAAVLMVITGCIKNMEAAYKTINWESIVLIAAMMPMSAALENTGTSSIISETLVSGLGIYGPLALLAGIYMTTSIMTLFVSNTATAVLLAPIAYAAALGIGVSPMPYMFAVAISASMCFASPFSTPPNALVMTAGQYKFMDYIKVGLPLQLIIAVVMIFVIPLLFPF